MPSTLTILTGDQGASAGTPGDGASGLALVALSGDGDVYTGGDAATLVWGAAGDSTVTLGDGPDAVLLSGGGNVVTLGTPGAARPALLTDQVWLAGSNNSVTTFVSADVVLAGDGNSASLTDASAAGGAPVRVDVLLSGTGDHITQSGAAGRGSVNVSGTGGGNYVSVADAGSILLGGTGNTVIVSGGSHRIVAGGGGDYVTLGGAAAPASGLQAVQLAGRSNQVSGTADAVITGGGGATAVTLGLAADGSSAYAVSLGGTGNTVAVGVAGSGTHGRVAIDAGAGGDTVDLAGAMGSVSFHGAGNALFLATLGGDAPLGVEDGGTGLVVTIAAGGPLGGAAPLTIDGFDPTGLIDFRPGVFGLTSAAQAAADLRPDGTGGSVLVVPGAGGAQAAAIHFTGNGHLTAANFAVG